MKYVTCIHEHSDETQWQCSDKKLLPLVSRVRLLQDRLLSKLQTLGFDLNVEAQLDAVTLEIIKTSEIEGEALNNEQVRSSVARHLGLDHEYLPTATREIDAYGREKVHFVVPSADKLSDELNRFLSWFNTSPNQQNTMDLLIKAGIAHLWFVMIHPFDDGNGRLTRAITERALAQSDDSPQRFYSMSAQILKQRNDYYKILERTKENNTDMTSLVSAKVRASITISDRDDR